jgi:8-oxo-dGTP pyrophosphatase MutT (NUDIX family)
MVNVALVIITNCESHRVLLQHRDKYAHTNPNVWALWGGKIDPEETPLASAAKRLHKELGLSVNPESLVFFNRYYPGHFLDDRDRFVFHLSDEGSFNYHLQEGDGFEFFSFDDLAKLDVDSISLQILREYFYAWKSRK